MLEGNWRVVERLEKHPAGTGGRFSESYVVESERGNRAFLKAVDYVEALDSPEPARALEAMTQAYNFERDLLGRVPRPLRSKGREVPPTLHLPLPTDH
jgi:hypothetical protein